MASIVTLQFEYALAEYIRHKKSIKFNNGHSIANVGQKHKPVDAHEVAVDQRNDIIDLDNFLDVSNVT
jgi:hypothetical protein